MFTYPITLNAASFGGEVSTRSFDLVDLQNSRSLSRVAASATTSPESLMVSHQKTGKGVIYDRHLVRLDKVFTDPVKGEVTLSSYLVLQVPRGTSVVTFSEIQNQIGLLFDFEQKAGHLDKILNNEP